MGIRLIILLALLIGVLYSIHLLVQDYQAVTAPKLLRLLFKRDTNAQEHKSHVRWRKILQHDPIQCARLLYCDLGAEPPSNEVRRGFISMLTLEPQTDDKPSLEIFKKAYQIGKLHGEKGYCKKKYPLCMFKAKLLMDFIEYLLDTH